MLHSLHSSLLFDHLDLKPDNLVINTENKMRVIDFGASHIRDGGRNERMETTGTVGYYQPMNKKDHGDRFAIGLLLVYLFSDQKMFRDIDNVIVSIGAVHSALFYKKQNDLTSIMGIIRSDYSGRLLAPGGPVVTECLLMTGVLPIFKKISYFSSNKTIFFQMI